VWKGLKEEEEQEEERKGGNSKLLAAVGQSRMKVTAVRVEAW